MAKSLSEFQVRAVAAIKEHGGRAIPAGGGYWNGADGTRLTVEPVGNSASGIVSTQTIRALERLGVLIRDNVDQREWRDSRSLVE